MSHNTPTIPTRDSQVTSVSDSICPNGAALLHIRGKHEKPLHVLVDADLLPSLSSFPWYALRKSGVVKYIFTYGIEHHRINPNGRKNHKIIYLHRMIMNHPKAPFVVDHINGNTLDNRKCNLRLATHQQNNVNSNGKKKIGKYRGVRKKPNGKYYATIRADGIENYLGTFETAESAARAYDNAARKFNGEFACLNFPD